MNQSKTDGSEPIANNNQVNETSNLELDNPEHMNRPEGIDAHAEQLIEPECERLLRATKKQVKRIMEEAVTRKFIHVDSGSIISLCVAVEACLSHRLKRRVLGLFKTNSSFALIQKLAKTCNAAQHILSSIERYKANFAEQRHRNKNNASKNKTITSDNNNNNSQCPHHNRRYFWIKLALIENKLVELVDHLATNASKYYESNALIADELCAQILSSLLVGPSALEFSRRRINESYLDEPTAQELMERHKLANPIACLCRVAEIDDYDSSFEPKSLPNLIDGQYEGKLNQRNRSHDNLTKDHSNEQSIEGSVAHVDSSNLNESDTTNGSTTENTSLSTNQSPLSRSLPNRSARPINRRRPLSIKTNYNKRAALLTDCHHLSCREIAEHQRCRGYSLLIHPMGPRSAPSTVASPLSISQSPNCSSSIYKNMARSSIKSKEQTQDSFALWSPRILHEIMHQNPRTKLIYAKNNILLEHKSNTTTPGYLSLHQTHDDLILKWIPNQMINGGNLSPMNSNCINNESDYSNDNQVAVAGYNNSSKLNLIQEPTPVESCILELMVSIPMSTVVLLHCRFETKSHLDDNQNKDQCPGHDGSEQVQPTTTIEETLILFEADGLQRAPFKFPKGGLRLFLSCLQSSLAPDRYLDPAINFDHCHHNQGQNECHYSNGFGLFHSSSVPERSLDVGSSSGPSSITTSGSGASRFDSFFRRFPSFKQRTSVKSSNGQATKLQGDPIEANIETESDQNKITQDKISFTNNYVYRIVSVHQSPTNLSSLDHSIHGDQSSVASSPSLIERYQLSSNSDGISSNRRNARERAGFRWNLRRWARFSLRTNASSEATSMVSQNQSETSNSLLESSSINYADRQSSAMSDQNLDNTNVTSELDNSQATTTTTTNVSTLLDTCDSLTSPQSFNRSDTHLSSSECANQSQSSGSEISSRQLARIEAKLYDLRKSTSDEVLESFRAQSIQTLCESMRKQILARAFYGWLLHCQRNKMIRCHLTHLLDLKKARQLLDTNASSKCSSNNCDLYSSGLNEQKWSELLKLPSVELQRKEMSLYVYYGGIDNCELRRKVWPILLGYHMLDDSQETRHSRDMHSRQTYEAAIAEWRQVESEVRRRDEEILAANMARAKQEEAKRNGIITEQQQTASNSNDYDNNQHYKLIGHNDNLAASSRSCSPKNSSTQKHSKSGIKCSPETKEKKNYDDKNDSIDRSKQQKDNHTENVSIQANELQRKRWRFESTGSVGPDAPITEQFGNNLHRIDKDVLRCDRSFWFYKDEKNLDRLREIMSTYIWQHLDVGYVQGMCDLAAPFLVIMDDQLQAFNCFNQLMKRMVTNFPPPHGTIMEEHFQSLKYLIQVLDPKLFEIMKCDQNDNLCFHFCYRWLLLDFKRELCYDDVYFVWETIWAARLVVTDHFNIFITLAMLRYYRDIIIENTMDYTDVHKFFSEMVEKHETKRIIELARDSVMELYHMMC